MRHPNLSATINDAIAAAEAADEIDLSLIGPGGQITFKTRNTLYIATRQEDGKWLVAGNPRYFDPKGEPCRIIGSTFGGSMIKINTIFVGGFVEIARDRGGIVTTSPVTQIGYGHSNRIH